ncbi:MAG: RrF2 family transcriptional regulator [Actinomycetes bacterium]
MTRKSGYALCALLELAAVEGQEPVAPPAEVVALRQQIPLSFLSAILGGPRAAGLVESQRGPRGGYRLARPVATISVADVIRAVEGTAAGFRGAARVPAGPRDTGRTRLSR